MSLSLCPVVCHHKTRACIRLLGPCYKTGRSMASLPSRQFQVLFTPFPKFFSSFPHGTCSLSVSRRYLALAGTYQPDSECNPKHPYSPTDTQLRYLLRDTGPFPSMVALFQDATYAVHLFGRVCRITTLGGRTPPREGLHVTPRFQLWALASSLAVTEAITVVFFSSAYWYA